MWVVGQKMTLWPSPLNSPYWPSWGDSLASIFFTEFKRVLLHFKLLTSSIAPIRPPASANLCSVCLSHCVLGQDTSPALFAGCGQRARWLQCMAALPQGNCGYNSVACHHLCVNVCVNGWMTICSVKRFGVLWTW